MTWAKIGGWRKREPVVNNKQVLTMPKVKVNDIQMFYEVHGEGFPLIMIQGLTANASWWDPRWIQTLSEKFKIIAFDNRGAGRTDISDREYSIKLFADDTASLMNALGIPRANVLAISMGGMIAQELVLNYPEKRYVPRHGNGLLAPQDARGAGKGARLIDWVEYRPLIVTKSLSNNSPFCAMLFYACWAGQRQI